MVGVYIGKKGGVYPYVRKLGFRGRNLKGMGWRVDEVLFSEGISNI